MLHAFKASFYNPSLTRMRLKLATTCLLLGSLSEVSALIHQQVAFDNSNICWWGLVPPDLICPILVQRNLTEIVNSIIGSYVWEGGHQCEDSFCLYANRGFAGGRGIAVITTPDNYARVKAVGDLLHKHEVSFNDLGSYPFHDAKIDGKGDGIIADKRLERGDPIMGHTPVLLVHRAFKEDIPQSQQQGLLDAAVAALPKPTEDLLMAHQMTHLPDTHRGAAILTTNAFLVDLNTDAHDDDDDSAHHFGAFPEVAKLNHDCRPNAAFYIDPTTLIHITTAVRAIQPGEEITLSSLDPFATHEERQDRVEKSWGSTCACSQCSLEGEERERSETRIQEIKWIEGKLADYSGDHSEVSTGLITYLLGLYETERLHCCIAGAYRLAANNFNGLGYAKQAKMYAELAIEALKIEKGEGATGIKDLEALIKEPKKHWTWSGRFVKGR